MDLESLAGDGGSAQGGTQASVFSRLPRWLQCVTKVENQYTELGRAPEWALPPVTLNKGHVLQKVGPVGKLSLICILLYFYRDRLSYRLNSETYYNWTLIVLISRKIVHTPDNALKGWDWCYNIILLTTK